MCMYGIFVYECLFYIYVCFEAVSLYAYMNIDIEIHMYALILRFSIFVCMLYL